MKLDISYIIRNEETLWKSIRWEDTPTCKCGCKEVYSTGDNRYKCKECGYTFSDTSNTLLQNSKLPKWKWLFAIYTLSAQRGVSVRELASLIGVSRSTSWLMLHKIRSYMSLDSVDLSGVVCMDEAHIGGWSGMHFNKKMEFMREHHFLPENHHRYTKAQILAASSEKKQHILCAINSEGKAKVFHIKGQITKDIIRQVVKKNGITHIISDESPLYRGIKGVTVEQSNHSKHIFMTKGGHTSNPCENRFSWVKRIISTYHTHSNDKYLQLYLNQIVFKINYSHLSVEDRFLKLGRLCCSKYMTHCEALEDSFQYKEKDWNKILESYGGLVESIRHKHRTYK